jgi:hypothetical protein
VVGPFPKGMAVVCPVSENTEDEDAAGGHAVGRSQQVRFRGLAFRASLMAD